MILHLHGGSFAGNSYLQGALICKGFSWNEIAHFVQESWGLAWECDVI